MSSVKKVLAIFLVLTVCIFAYFLLNKKDVSVEQPVINNDAPTNLPTNVPTKAVTEQKNKTTNRIQLIDKDIIGKYNIKGYATTTYCSAGFYFTCKKAEKAEVYYRKIDSKVWNKAYTPNYSNTDGMYKGSIVNLLENSEYNIKIELIDDKKVTGRLNIYATTWTSNVNITDTIKLSDLVNVSVTSNIIISDIHGNENSWKKIICDIPINNSKSNDIIHVNEVNGKIVATKNKNSSKNTDALLISNCSYILIDDALLKGGTVNGAHIVRSDDIRMNNANISGYGRTASQYNAYGVGLDTSGKRINYDSGILLEKTKRVTIENCYVHDPVSSANAWNDKYNSESHPCGPNAMYFKESGGNNVIRYNNFAGSDIHRFNDIIEGWNNSAVNGGVYRDSDIYGNLLAYGNDDGIELDGGQINVRVFNNRIIGTLTGISVVPNLSGPSYIFRNEFIDLADVTGKSNYVIKTVGSELSTYGDTYVFHNLMYANDYVLSVSKDSKRGADIESRNNIMLTNKHVVINNVSDTPMNSYDYDMLFNRHKKLIFAKKTQHEKHGIIANPTFTDENIGNYTLKKASKGIDQGLILDNFSDGYKGSKPDMGVYEYGIEANYLGRASHISTDMTCINLASKKTCSLTIKASSLNEKEKVSILKSDNDNWYNVTLSNDEISSDSKIKVNITLNNSKIKESHSVFIVKLSNNNSIPICVKK